MSGKLLRSLPVVIAALSATFMAGCGGGGTTAPPSVSGIVVLTNPTPMGYLGGTSKVTLLVTDPVGVDSSTVKIDLIDSTGASVISGPQVMQKSLTVTDSYSYTLPIPNNLTGTSNKVLKAQVTAADLKGVAIVTPVVVATITVPFPPPGPGGP